MVETRYGWLNFRPALLQYLSKPPVFLFILCWAAATNGALINGFVNVSLTSIERRFGLSTTTVGVIPSSFDLAQMLAAIPVSYYGGRASHTRVLGWGQLLLCAGSLLMVVPHFATLGSWSVMDTTLDSGSAGFCTQRQEQTEPEQPEPHSSMSAWALLIALAMLVNGLGSAPMSSSAYAYMDHNLSTGDFSLYSALFTLAQVVGPGIGYMLGGFFLSRPFNDFFLTSSRFSEMSDKELDAVRENANFIGAYWVGFLLTAAGFALVSLPLMGFPAEFPGSGELREARKVESYGSVGGVEEEDEVRTEEMSVNDFKNGAKHLATNPVFICLALASGCGGFWIAVCSAFSPKYLEVVFLLTSSRVAYVMGVVAIPVSSAALLLGGLLPKLLRFTLNQLLVLCTVSCVIMSVASLGFYVDSTLPPTLPPQDQVRYNAHTCDVSACACSPSVYEPQCLDKGTVVYSACYYGCRAGDALRDCLCYNATINTSLEPGKCHLSNNETGEKLYWTLAAMALAIFMELCHLPSALAALGRSVKARYRSLAFGAAMCTMRLVGTFPGPLAAGSVFDSRCRLQNRDESGAFGSCVAYETKITQDFTLLLFISSVAQTFFFFGALFFVTSDQESKKNQSYEQLILK